ncbi:MAG: GH36-type glycosyl hydrolase domain-containing protein [Phycisphaerae bacterium]
MAKPITSAAGRFTADGRAFEIADVRLEGVWDHYISNDRYCVVLSQTWCGYSFYRSRPLYPVSITGRFAFIRDRDSGEVWPVNEPSATAGQSPSYEQLHGLSGDQSSGSARFRTPLETPPLSRGTDELTVTWEQGAAGLVCLRDGVRVSMRLAVATHDAVELWTISVENLSGRPRRLALMPTLSFHLGAGIAMAGNATVCSFTDIDRPAKAIIARMEGIRKSGVDNIVGIFASVDGPSPDGFFGTLDSAQEALLSDSAQEAQAFGEEAVAMLRVPLALEPGQKAQCAFIVGAGKSPAAVRKLAAKYRGQDVRAADGARIKEFWDGVAARQVIHTPDGQLDRFYNSWLKYEMWQVGRWNRGEGRGYRDTLQDSEGMALLDEAFAWRLIEMCLIRQRADGWAVREFDETLPGTTSPRDFRDSAVWLPFALDTYLRETGRVEVLDGRYEYMDGAKGTVWEHAAAACEFLMKHRGRHGLPLIAGGDWNDALDRAGIGGKGESVWLAIALHRALVMLRDIAVLMAGREGGRRFRTAASALERQRAVLEKAIQSAGWDGRWYRRAFDDAGRVIGGRACREGKLFLLPQAWAAFSGLGDDARIEKALAATEQHLANAWGYAKLWPGYTRRDMCIGRLTVRAAGLGENAGIHTHAVTFRMKADLARGHGTRAYETLRKIAPIDGHFTAGEADAANARRNLIPAEPPYTLANQRIGPEHPDFGAHKNRWLSGSVSWMLRLVTEDMLGARAEIGGLRIAPCLPAGWRECRIERTFRGAVYDIRITKPEAIERGRVSLTLDGRPVQGDLLPVQKAGTTHRVDCVVSAANA